MEWVEVEKMEVPLDRSAVINLVKKPFDAQSTYLVFNTDCHIRSLFDQCLPIL